MSRFKERIKKQIHLLQQKDTAELRRFQRELFGGENAIQVQEEHHRWLFDENPYNGNSPPQFWIYRDNERKIQGQQAGIPYLLQIGERVWRASWGIDLMVSPLLQARGIGAVLNELYVQQNEVTTAVGITEAAQKAHRRAGWLDLGTIPLYARPLSTAGIQAGFPEGSPKGTIAAIAGYPLLCLAESIWKSYASGKKARLLPVTRFDERSDAVWKSASRDYPVLAQRDLKYLRWRFDLAPSRADYQRYYYYEGEDLKGYAVIRFGKRGDRPAALLSDFLCPAFCQKALLALVIHAARTGGANDLHCAVLSPHLREKEMKMLGFIPLPLRSHFMAIPAAENGPDRALLSNPNNWFITMANSDMEWMYLD